jgi:hypothetical protein
MPVVAGHSASVAVRNLRLLVIRCSIAALLLVLLVVAVGQIWLALASGSLLSQPPRGSSSFAILARLDPSIVTDLALKAAGAALDSDANADRAPRLLRHEYAQQLVVRALGERPIQPKLWLLRAALLNRVDPDDARSVASVKMAYFTSSFTGDIALDRLRAALQLAKLNDPELGDLVRADIAALLLQRPDLQSALIESYRTASATGQILMLRVVADLKPELLPALR